MPEKIRSNIRFPRKHFYIAVIATLLLSFGLASVINSGYYFGPNEDKIVSIEVARRFAPFFFLCIITGALLRFFRKRVDEKKLAIVFCVFLLISCFTITSQLFFLSNKLRTLTSFVSIRQDHFLSYLASTRHTNAPHRKFLFYFRARRFLKHAIIFVPSEHEPDSRLTTLCRASISHASYNSDMSREEAKKLLTQKHIALPAGNFTYIFFPGGEGDIRRYYVRKADHIFFILPLSLGKEWESIQS